MEESQYEEFDLTDPLVLPTLDPCSEFTFILNPPPSIPQGFAVAILLELPWGGRIVWNTDGKQIAIYTQPLFQVPVWARTETFTIRVTAGGNDTDFRVTLPVSLGIRRTCESHRDISGGIFSPGQNVSILFYGSGPQGTRTWSWNPIDGAPLPSGLSLQAETDQNAIPTGHALIRGTIQEGAHSSRAFLRLVHGTDSVQREANIAVQVHLSPTDRANLAVVREITRGQNFSLQLPDALGGDGNPANYTWEVEPGSALPAGLAIVRRGTNLWIEGVVADTAPVEARRVRLKINSGQSLGVSARAEMNFHLSIPFRVWTQNSTLFPSDYIPTWSLVGLCLWPFSPPCVTATAVEVAWDQGINNTDEDNGQRAGLIHDHLASQQQPGRRSYDIVALQEVWESPFTEGMRDRIVADAQNLGYSAFDGPADSGLEISSGLVLLVHNHLSVSSYPPEVFNDDSGFDGLVQDGMFDGLAQKGFTLSRISFGPDPNDFIFILNTHLQADDQASVRDNQLDEIQRFLNANVDRTHPVILMGDFNIAATGPEYRPMLNRLGDPDDVFGDGAGPFTSDTESNAYAHFWNDSGQTKQERIDYILIQQGTQFHVVVDNQLLENTHFDPGTFLCKDPRTRPFSGWLIGGRQGLSCYLSDHFGLSAELRLVKI